MRVSFRAQEGPLGFPTAAILTSAIRLKLICWLAKGRQWALEDKIILECDPYTTPINILKRLTLRLPIYIPEYKTPNMRRCEKEISYNICIIINAK